MLGGFAAHPTQRFEQRLDRRLAESAQRIGRRHAHRLVGSAQAFDERGHRRRRFFAKTGQRLRRLQALF